MFGAGLNDDARGDQPNPGARSELALTHWIPAEYSVSYPNDLVWEPLGRQYSSQSESAD
jgi:hypothetical protein